MKKLLTLAALVSLFFFSGCNEQTDITSPTDGFSDQPVNWITLPSPTGMSVNSTSFTHSELIDGVVGGDVRLRAEYEGGPFGTVKINSKLVILENSFAGTVDISTTCFPEEGLVEFGPSMVFEKNLEYTLDYVGIDLGGVNPETVKFFYIAADGSIVEAENSSIFVDIELGRIKVRKALIPHFSRYGFVH